MDVSFVTFFQGFRKRWKLLAAVVFASWVAGTIYILVTPNKYTTDVIFYIDDSLDSKQQSSALSGLAASIGLGSSQSNARQVALATLRSRQLATDFVRKYNLLPVLFPDYWNVESNRWTVAENKVPTLVAGAETFMALRTIGEDPTSGTVTLTLTLNRPDLVAPLANNFVKFGDDVLRQHSLSRSQDSLDYLKTQIRDSSTTELRTSITTLMEADLQHITLVKTNGAFQLNIIDSAIAPASPSWPRKGLVFSALTLFAFFAGAMISIALDLHAARRLS